MSNTVVVFAGQKSGIRVTKFAAGFGNIEDTVARLIDEPRLGLVSVGRGARSIPPAASSRAARATDQDLK